MQVPCWRILHCPSPPSPPRVLMAIIHSSCSFHWLFPCCWYMLWICNCPRKDEGRSRRNHYSTVISWTKLGFFVRKYVTLRLLRLILSCFSFKRFPILQKDINMTMRMNTVRRVLLLACGKIGKATVSQRAGNWRNSRKVWVTKLNFHINEVQLFTLQLHIVLFLLLVALQRRIEVREVD